MGPKKTLDIPNLSDNGIKLDERPVGDVDDATTYFLERYRCPQASIVAEGLLDFDGILSESNFGQFSDKIQEKINDQFAPSRIPPPDQNESRSTIEMQFYKERYRIADHDARFKLAQHISREARNISVAKETRWSAIVKNQIFGSLIRSTRTAEGIGMYDSRDILQSVKIEDEDTWLQGHTALKRTTPKSATPLTAPKADLYIALPIIRRALNSRGFHKDDYIQNFTVDSLARLAERKHRSLISNPITQLDKLREVKENHLVCFPATVIELKHHAVSRKEKDKCYSQAANAASTALAMLNRLSLYSIPEESFGEIRPVVAFTFIGYESKVWIAFIRKKVKEGGKLLCEYKMKCIWEGDLREVWDTLQLCRIIENVRYWIISHFRPWVSSCLDGWRWADNEDDDEDDGEDDGEDDDDDDEEEEEEEEEDDEEEE